MSQRKFNYSQLNFNLDCSTILEHNKHLSSYPVGDSPPFWHTLSAEYLSAPPREAGRHPLPSGIFMNDTMIEQSDKAAHAATDGARSASGSVFYGIMSGLEARTFVPGQRLVEVDLAAQYGVSRNSVREALQRLAAEGVVELSRNRGAAIRSLTLRQTLEVLDVAERMTGLLARSAAQGIADGHPGGAIEAALDDLSRADQAHDGEAFTRGRRNLYRALLQTSGSQELRRLFPAIQMPVVYAQHRPATLQKVRMRDYRVMCDAILAGNASAADKAAMAHVQNVRAAIVRGTAT